MAASTKTPPAGPQDDEQRTFAPSSQTHYDREFNDIAQGYDKTATESGSDAAKLKDMEEGLRGSGFDKSVSDFNKKAGGQAKNTASPEDLGKAEQSGEPSLYRQNSGTQHGPAKGKPLKQRIGGIGGFIKSNKRKFIIGGIAASSGGALIALFLQLGALLPTTLTDNIEKNRLRHPMSRLAVSSDVITKLKLKIDSTGDAEYLRALNTYADQPSTGLFAKVNRLRPAKIAEQLLLNTEFEYRQARIPGTNVVRERVSGVKIGNDPTFSIPQNSTPLVGKVRSPLKHWNAIRGYNNDIRTAAERQILQSQPGLNAWQRLVVVSLAAKKYRQLVDIKRVRWSKEAVDEANQRAQINREQARAEAVKDSYDKNRPLQATPTTDAARAAQQQTDACIDDSDCRNQMTQQGDTISPQASQGLRSAFAPNIARSAINTIGSVSELGGIACLVAKAGISASPDIIDANSAMAVSTFTSLGAASGQQIYTQQNEGDSRVNATLTGGYNDQMNHDGGASRSNPMSRAGGQSFDTSNTLSPQSSAVGLLGTNPFRLLPGNVSQTLNGSTFCDLMGNIWFQGAVTAGELLASLIPGVGQAVKAGGTATAKTVSTIVAKQLGNVLKQQFSRTQLARMAAVGGVGVAAELTSAVEQTRALQEIGAAYNGASQGENYINQADAGATVLAQEINRQNGGRPLTTSEYTVVKEQDEEFQRQMGMEQGFTERYLAMSNPDSLAQRLASTLYYNLSLDSLTSVVQRAASIFNPTQLLSGLPSVTTFAQEQQELEAPIMQREYGVTQWGWSAEEEQAYLFDDEFAPLYNEDQLSNERRTEIADKYGKCFDPSIGTMGNLLADEDIYRDDLGNVLPGEGKDCDPDKLGALSDERVAALTSGQNCTGNTCVAAVHTEGSLTFASQEAADVFRYRVSLRNNMAADQLLKVQEPDPDNPTGVGVGPVSVDGYYLPMAPGTQRDYGTLPCTPERYQATVSGIGVCHHDGTGAFDLFFGPNGATDGLPVYAITEGEILNVNPYPSNNPVPGCYAINFKSSLDGYHYWYGHLQNPRTNLVGQTIPGGTQIAEVARNSLGERCRGGRDHLHIDRGCTKDALGGSVGCRDPGLVEVMMNLWSSLEPDSGGGQ